MNVKRKIKNDCSGSDLDQLLEIGAHYRNRNRRRRNEFSEEYRGKQQFIFSYIDHKYKFYQEKQYCSFNNDHNVIIMYPPTKKKNEIGSYSYLHLPLSISLN